MRGCLVRRPWTAAVTFVMALAACGRADRTPHSDSRSSAPRLAAAARTYPGALTKPLDAYSGDELYELTRALSFTGSHERARRCRDAAGCTGTAPTHRTIVQVSGVATQDSIGLATVPPFGVVYARAINRGDATEARYHIRPGATLRYYLVIHRDSAGVLAWRLEELDTAPPRRHTTVATGRIRGCGHAWRRGAQADFRSCAQEDRGDTVATLPLLMRQSAGFDDPLWIECDEGCCQAVEAQ